MVHFRCDKDIADIDTNKVQRQEQSVNEAKLNRGRTHEERLKQGGDT